MSAPDDDFEALRAAMRPHQDLYFQDGDIILVAECIHFRVHSGLLARHSEIFRGMMDIPQPDDAPSLDGCPLIGLHDKMQELTYLLRALYDGLYFEEGRPIEFMAISAILRLATKYFFTFLRRRALNRLRLDWPSTLADWDDREQAATSLTGIYKPSLLRTHPILIINLARELSLPSLLPAAFYDLSRYTPSQILRGSPTTPGIGNSDGLGPRQFLTQKDLLLVFQGKEAGQVFVSLLIAKELENCSPATWCRTTHLDESKVCCEAFGMVTYETLRAVVGLTAVRESDPLFLLQGVIEMLQPRSLKVKELSMAEEEVTKGCEVCRAKLRAAIQRARQSIWDSIPGWFGVNIAMLEDL